jgi:hypothetical protein
LETKISGKEIQYDRVQMAICETVE